MSIRSLRSAARPAPGKATAAAGPAGRRLALGAALLLVTAPAGLLGASPASADGATHRATPGRAGAAVLRTGLEVGLLNKSVDLPLNLTLNAVRAPRTADRSALSAHLDAVDGGRPFSVLRADVATARADADTRRATASSELAHATVHLPGLPLLPLLRVDQVSATVTCQAGRRPTAAAHLPGSVEVLGKKVTVAAGGTTTVNVPAVGTVRLALAQHTTTSATAAASALDLQVRVNPLKLNVADVAGRITLAGATCTAPVPARSAARPSPAPTSKGTAPGGATTQIERTAAAPAAHLAETGATTTPYLAGGAAALVAAGGGALLLARRRRGNH